MSWRWQSSLNAGYGVEVASSLSFVIFGFEKFRDSRLNAQIHKIVRQENSSPPPKTTSMNIKIRRIATTRAAATAQHHCHYSTKHRTNCNCAKRQKFSADSPWNYDNTFLCIRREPESRRSFALHFDSGCLRLVNKVNFSEKAYFTPRHRSGEGEGMLRTRVRRELMLGRLSSVIQFRL